LGQLLHKKSETARGKIAGECPTANFIVRDFGFVTAALQGRGSVPARFPENATGG
jgi:hypothetical protein